MKLKRYINYRGVSLKFLFRLFQHPHVQEIGAYLNKFILKVKLQMPLSRAIDLVYAFSEKNMRES
jgi:hypothetical protein